MTPEEVLKAALAGKSGWREMARISLGLAKSIQCEGCENKFLSGGKNKLFCSNKCRLENDPRKISKICSDCGSHKFKAREGGRQ